MHEKLRNFPKNISGRPFFFIFFVFCDTLFWVQKQRKIFFRNPGHIETYQAERRNFVLLKLEFDTYKYLSFYNKAYVYATVFYVFWITLFSLLKKVILWAFVRKLISLELVYFPVLYLVFCFCKRNLTCEEYENQTYIKYALTNNFLFINKSLWKHILT